LEEEASAELAARDPVHLPVQPPASVTACWEALGAMTERLVLILWTAMVRVLLVP